jgi:class 3 adenylate cyclase
MYDVFGDTINTASRFESSGKASHVHTSKQVLALLDEYKELIDVVPESEGGHRNLNLKGIGEVETVLISHVRPPKNDTGTDQGTQITFAEIHSR